MSKKIVTCKTCGAQIAKNSPTCPACGSKKKGKPFWVVFVVLGLFIFIYSLGSTTSENALVKVDTSTSTSQEQTIIYTPYSVGQLVDDLEKNALKAEKTYQDQYLELTGALSVIDSDGDYIGIYPSDNLFALTGVQCFIGLQQSLCEYISASARYYGCQFIIATHSPVLLSMPNALIYDLDEYPVSTKKWTELNNVRKYFEFFEKHRHEFESK